jgi:hypothetical protein
MKMPKDSIIDELLDTVLGGLFKAAAEAEAIKVMAKEMGLGESGTQLLAMGHRLRHFAKDCIDRDGEVDPTLWVVDTEGRQWALGAEVTNSDTHDASDSSPEAIAMLLKKLGAACYLIVRETESVKISMNMTLLEKRAARADPANVKHVVCLFGEAIDGAALVISYEREGPNGQIDVNNPLSSTIGPKDNWPGPPGSQFIDHGMRELLPRPGQGAAR